MIDEFAESGDGDLPVFTARRMIQTALVVLLLVVGIYFLFPKLVGLGDAWSQLGDADLKWIAVAIAFNVVAFGTYIALFRAVVGGDVLPLRWTEAYEINMAGLAATLLFSAGGAGGIVLTFWALRKAGMRQHDAGRRMVTFLVLHYAFYPLTVIIFGILLRTGVLEGTSSVELTVIPAGIAGAVLIFGLVFAMIPDDVGERMRRYPLLRGHADLVEKLAKIPSTVAAGVRGAIGLFASPRKGGLAVIGAAGFWAANIGILWASFAAFNIHLPFGVLVMGFFLGMAANLIPFAPAGVGAVDAGMIGAFVLFGIDEVTVFPAILTYRFIAFWIPIPPGIVAFIQLRKRITRWETEGLPVNRPVTS